MKKSISFLLAFALFHPLAATAQTAAPTVGQSFNQITGAEANYTPAKGGDYSAQVGYNPYRVVPQGASMGRALKLGDLQNTLNPSGTPIFKLDSLTLRQMIGSASMSVADSPYLSGLSLADVARLNNNQLPASLVQTIMQQARPLDQYGSLSGNAGTLVGKLASDPALKNVSLGQLASENYGGLLDATIQRGAAAISQQLPPALRSIPLGALAKSIQSGQLMNVGRSIIGSVRSGNWSELSSVALGSVAPGLDAKALGGVIDTSLSSLPGIKDQYLDSIPGLGDLSLSKLTAELGIPVSLTDVVAQLDVAYAGPVETPALNVYTGSTENQKFKPEPCVKGKDKAKNCPGFELGYLKFGVDLGKVKGKVMVQGSSQPVKGGKGPLKALNGGLEPTGWLPFTEKSPIKFSLEDIKEGSGKSLSTARIQANLQICYTIPFVGVTCSPRFIPIPTPFKVHEKGPILLLSSSGPPAFLQNAINSLQDSPQYCNAVASVGAAPDQSKIATAANNLPKTGESGAQGNIRQYLARIAAGESGGGTNIGAPPTGDAPYGEYQFRGSTRQLVLNQYPGLDAFSPDKATHDKAAIAWIGMYGNELGTNILASIQQGDFASADRALGKSQFTSLPGGAEQSRIWSDASNLQKYGPATKGGNAGFAPSSNIPCQGSGTGSSPGAYTGPSSGQLNRPVDGPMTSEFGPRARPCAGCSANHMGLDFGVGDGTSVKTAGTGKVVFYGWLKGYGNTMFVDHGGGLMTQYSHLQNGIAAVGSTVQSGAVIAQSGHTGVGTGAHLHFGVIAGTSNGNIHSGSYINPRTVLR